MKRKPLGNIARTAYAVIALFMVMQLIPYGRRQFNPPVLQEPNWDSAATRELARRACFDCHSNRTVWPRYSMIAPLSWLIYNDVTEAREHLNFSEWRKGNRRGEEISKEIEEGEMPPFRYRIAHPEARLSDEEKRALIEGLTATANRLPPNGIQ
jgi:mono/diheme cytochrome c family protein